MSRRRTTLQCLLSQTVECTVVYLAFFALSNYLLETFAFAHVNPPSIVTVAFPPVRTMAAAAVAGITLSLARSLGASLWLLMTLGALCPLVGDFAAAASATGQLWIPRDGYLFAMPVAGGGSALWLLLRWPPRVGVVAVGPASSGERTLTARLRPYAVALATLPTLASPLPFIELPAWWYSLRPPLSYSVAACGHALIWATLATLVAVWPSLRREPPGLHRLIALLFALGAWILGLASYDWTSHAF